MALPSQPATSQEAEATGLEAEAPGQETEATGLDLLCPLLEHERQRALDDARLELELVKNEFQSRSDVFDMVEELWRVRSIERETYLDYKRLRDRTGVRIKRVQSQIAQQQAIAEQYELVCGRLRGAAQPEDPAARLATLQAEYRRLDCELLKWDAEIARVDHDVYAEIVEASRTMSESEIKSRFELILDEYDLVQSKARMEGYRRRARECRAELSG